MGYNQSINEQYGRLLSELRKNGLWELNQRTDTRVRVLPGARCLQADLSYGFLPVVGNRRMYPGVAAAECAWQFMGTRDPKFMQNHAPKLWDKFLKNGEVPAAYGYRWREHFGRDQVEAAIDALVRDPSSRQVYLSAWDARTDGLGTKDQPPNIPCPVGFSLTTTTPEDEPPLLHMSVFVRSSDVVLGLPYDIMCYALTLDALAASCNRTPGTMHFTLAHAHYYEPHEEATEGGWGTWATPMVHLPGWTVEEIVADPDGYVSLVKRLSRRTRQSKQSFNLEVVV